MTVEEGRGRRNQENKYRILSFLEGVMPIKFYVHSVYPVTNVIIQDMDIFCLVYCSYFLA